MAVSLDGKARRAAATPHEIFQQAVTAGIRPTIRECWSDFAHWEIARRYADDPSRPAKAAIEWIDLMESLRADLAQFRGDTRSDCLDGLDSAVEAFAHLEHSDELVQAISVWLQYRLDEQT